MIKKKVIPLKSIYSKRLSCHGCGWVDPDNTLIPYTLSDCCSHCGNALRPRTGRYLMEDHNYYLLGIQIHSDRKIKEFEFKE